MNNTHRRIHWMLIGILVVAFMLVATAAVAQQAEEPEEEPPEPVATVNDVQMNADHVKEALADWYPGATVKRLIDREIIRQEAARRGVEITDEQVAAALKERRAEPWEFQQYLGRRGLSEAQFRQQLRWDLALGTLADDFRDRFIQSQARNYYEANRSEFTAGPQVHIYELVTDDIKEAYLARERIAGGESFEAVAKDMSIQPENIEVGWMPREEYHLAPHITDLGIGEITPPVREGDNYYIAYLKEYSEQRQASYEQVKPRILQKLRERVNFTEQEYLEYLARRANVTIQHEDFTYLNAYFDSLDGIRVMVGGEYISLDPKPRRLQGGHLVCILKPLLQHLDAAVTWDHEKQVMTAQNPLGRVRLTVGETTASVGIRDVRTVELPTEPTLENGRVIGPPRTALEALGAEVIWDGVRNVLQIKPPEIPEKTTGGLQTNE
ncbi:MAG: stalk domain-containing protein [Armatimonadota bacterium]